MISAAISLWYRGSMILPGMGSTRQTESELFMAISSARYLLICDEDINLGTARCEKLVHMVDTQKHSLRISYEIFFLGILITKHNHIDMKKLHIQILQKQGKSEGFESCDRPIVRKCPIWVKIGDILSRVTLKFDGWPWKTIGHLSFAVSSFVQHFIAIGEFKLELLSGNTQFGSNSKIFRAVWPWNLTDDLEKQ